MYDLVDLILCCSLWTILWQKKLLLIADVVYSDCQIPRGLFFPLLLPHDYSPVRNQPKQIFFCWGDERIFYNTGNVAGFFLRDAKAVWTGWFSRHSWWILQNSNPEPAVYMNRALTIHLPIHILIRRDLVLYYQNIDFFCLVRYRIGRSSLLHVSLLK